MTLVPETIHWIIGLILILAALLYIGSQVVAFVKAPTLTIDSPAQFNLITHNDVFLVKGSVSQKSQIFLNGEELAVGENGLFQKKIILVPGENILNFKAINRRGKRTYAQRKLIFDKSQ